MYKVPPAGGDLPFLQSTAGNFYGAVGNGGANRTGVVYRLTLSGQYTELYSFTARAVTETSTGHGYWRLSKYFVSSNHLRRIHAPAYFRRGVLLSANAGQRRPYLWGNHKWARAARPSVHPADRGSRHESAHLGLQPVIRDRAV